MSETPFQIGDIVQVKHSGSSRPPSYWLVVEIFNGAPRAFSIRPKPSYPWSLVLDPAKEKDCGLSEEHIIVPTEPFTLNPDLVDKVVGRISTGLMNDSMAEYKLNQ